MRLAVISDIHGNVAALEAALDDIARRGITNIICLGDCASGMCWPAETTRLLMEKNIPTIRGNHDRWLTDRVAEGLKGQDGFAFQETTADQRAWLYALPERITPAPGILACHGTPSSDLRNLLEDPRHGVLMPSPLSAIRERLGEDGMAARVVLCGHSHQASVIHMPGDGPLVVNPGSLGLPGFRVTRGDHPHRAEARSPHARYAIIHAAEGAKPMAELVSLVYDWESAARRAEAVGANAAWPHVLRTGYLPESLDE
ncbi:MAG: metallophosphoesterase family protein [Roseomonas sp.]|nr:metallophosphoesterase family protein [Roseomonas sp.]MCA3393728.1 metallophosphoesterase family protein [Roseomonas sp.]MCA3405724.1 metallophosphoesterase family protein [Roseomonas sp.]